MDLHDSDFCKDKIRTAEDVLALIGPRPREKRVIMCHGTFDIVHPGHVRHLMYAKSKADVLIASLTADRHIAKANVRPYVPEQLRAFNLAALEMVDYVIIDGEAKPLKNLELIKPDYFAKGYEYTDGHIDPRTQEEIDILEGYGGEIIFTPGDIVYSSSHIIENAPPDLKVEKLVLLMQSEGISFDDLRGALARSRGARVHVVGDTIVDSYTNCSMIGGGTKTPTMSLRFERKVDYVGGAGVVAKHLKAAGADVTFTTVLGDDAHKDFVLEDLSAAGVECQPTIDPTRPTTNKNAIVAGGYRLLKVDTLDNRSIAGRVLGEFQDRIRSVPADIAVFSDFRHGIFNRETAPELIEAIPSGMLCVADSQVASRWGNILEFPGFDLITPNEREARFALGDQDSVVRPLASSLRRMAKARMLILKLGERGILTHRDLPDAHPRAVVSLDSTARHVVDAVGAGDALLAYASLALQTTGNELIAGILGCMAAGLECEVDGNQPITPAALLEAIAMIERRAHYLPQQVEA